jgi:hypothetical protein
MADRYWVGGAGNWTSSNTTNWSTTSGGSGGASVPTSSDKVIINSASNPGPGAYAIYIVGTQTVADCSIDTTYAIIGDGGSGALTVTGTVCSIQGFNAFGVALNINCPTLCNFFASSQTFNVALTFNNVSLQTNVTTGQGITASGRLVFGNTTGTALTITCGNFTGTSSLTEISYTSFQNNSIYLTVGAGTIWDTSACSSLYVVLGSVTVYVNSFTTATTKTIYCQYPAGSISANLNFYVSGGAVAGTLFISGSSSTSNPPSVNNLEFQSTFVGTATFLYGLISYGNITMPSSGSATINFNNPWTIYNNRSPTIIVNQLNPTTVQNIEINGFSSFYVTWGGGASSTPNFAIRHFAGYLNFSYDVSFYSYTTVGTTAKVLNMGTGNWTIGNGGWNNTQAASTTINPETSTITLAATSVSTNVSFTGGNTTYNNLVFGGGTQTGVGYYIKDSNTFNAVSGTKPAAYTIYLGDTTTITMTVSSWNVNGYNNTQRVLVQGTPFTTGSTLINNGANSITNYANINSVNATGSAIWYRTSATSLNAYSSGFTLLDNSGTFFLL